MSKLQVSVTLLVSIISSGNQESSEKQDFFMLGGKSLPILNLDFPAHSLVSHHLKIFHQFRDQEILISMFEDPISVSLSPVQGG